MKLYNDPKVLRRVLVSRNKLIEDLIVNIPATDSAFKRAMAMRDRNFENDKTIWKEAKLEAESAG